MSIYSFQLYLIEFRFYSTLIYAFLFGMEILLLIISGAVVGFIVGLTGVGGGALMTPILLFFGVPPHIAIGTDLWFAALTKSGGVVTHQKLNHIKWNLVIRLALGSLPAAIITGLALTFLFGSAENYSHILTTSLGIMLVITASVLFFRNRLQEYAARNAKTESRYRLSTTTKTVIVGALLGTFVTLSSVGAGAIGTAVLLILYPKLLPKEIVGTDLAHAVPLTFIAGVVHLTMGNVDLMLLLALLIGSLPAIHLGSRAASKVSSGFMQPLLIALLLILGLKYALF